MPFRDQFLLSLDSAEWIPHAVGFEATLALCLVTSAASRQRLVALDEDSGNEVSHEPPGEKGRVAAGPAK